MGKGLHSSGQCQPWHDVQDFIELYKRDMEKRLKPSTVAGKKWLIDLKITPFFGRYLSMK